MKLSKSEQEYLANAGWSSNLFVEHAKFVFAELKGKAAIDVGRTVIHIKTADKTLKVYVHHNGRTKEYVTLTDSRGEELQTFHHSCSPQELLQAILQLLK